MLEVGPVGQFAVRQTGQVFPRWRHQQQTTQTLGVAVAPAQGLVEPAGDHPVGEVRIEHNARTLIRQVQVVIEHATIPVNPIRRPGQLADPIQHHGDGRTGQQGRAQVLCPHGNMMGGEIIERPHRQGAAVRIHQATLHEQASGLAAEEVGADQSGQSQAKTQTAVASHQPTAANHHDHQPVVLVMQDVLVAILQQLGEHRRTATTHFPGGNALGKSLAGVELRQPLQP